MTNPESLIADLRKQVETVDGSGFFTTQPKPVRQAINRLMHQLSRGSKSEKQLRDYLIKRETEVEAIESAIETVRGYGLIDDFVLAQNIVRVKSEVMRLSKRKIRSVLQTKGIPQNIIAEVLSNLDPELEILAAQQLASSRAKKLAGLERQAALRRLVGFLQRRGYSASVSFTVARNALESAVKLPSNDEPNL